MPYSSDLVCYRAFSEKVSKLHSGNLPPVTSHIASIGEESEGTRPVSLSTAGVPASLSTNENSLWSHRNGSRVNSEPGIGQFIGRLN